MTRWIALFTDGPEMMGVRREREPAHLAYLRQHGEHIRIGGGLREQPGGPFVGGLWVIEADTREQAVALIENDPYYVPAWRSYRLLVWGKALPGDVIL
ncbi:YciI family protein [Ferrovibrio sp.]|uniref:YciI family protein n=1 Tax=Ferrovibrio sp. TaxID=1917215 RepID=UPI002623057B|nr:YciI family protein [Ferrovibrio sp.]